MAALDPNTGCPPIAPCVQAAHPTEHLHQNSFFFQAKHEFDQNRVKTGPKSATGELPIITFEFFAARLQMHWADSKL